MNDFNGLKEILNGEKEFPILLEFDMVSILYLGGGALVVGILLIFIGKYVIK